MEYYYILIILTVVFGLLMACGIGANDVANAMGASVGTKALDVKKAIAIAATFEFAGAFLAGGSVTETIGYKLIDISAYTGQTDILVWGMLAALLAAAVWVVIAIMTGLPASTTHCTMGAILGFGIVTMGVGVVEWDMIGIIVLSWIVSPLIAGLLAFLLFVSVQRLILRAAEPFVQAQRYVPFYIFLAGMAISLIATLQGFKNLGWDLSIWANLGIALLLGIFAMLLGTFFLRRIVVDKSSADGQTFVNVEKIFTVLMIFTACAMAFAHGSNDVSNAAGPMAAILGVVKENTNNDICKCVLLIGAIGIVIGLFVYGHRIMAAMGEGIAHLTPSRAFAAELGAAMTIVTASAVGLPLSTTQTLVGAVLGVGFARGIGAINLNVVRGIFSSALVTLPAGAILSIIFFFILKAVFG